LMAGYKGEIDRLRREVDSWKNKFFAVKRKTNPRSP
jgi:hypothetical protein